MARVVASADFRLVVLGTLLFLCAERSVVLAQQPPDQAIMDLNREAMEAYNALDVNRAGSLLTQALNLAQQNGVTGPTLAQTHMNLGVVSIGGFSNSDAGLASFTQALCIDKAAQLDPLTSSPDIQNVFSVATQRTRAGACGGAAPPQQTAPQQPMAPQPPMVIPQPPPDQALAHQVPPEQLAQTPLPLYVEVNPAAHAKKIFLYYQGLGMEKWKRVPMYQYASGFAYQLSCNDVWEPKVSYYIEALDTDDHVVGVVASAIQPVVVPVVATRTKAETSLPNAPAPKTCTVKECPPGLAGCTKGGKAGIGEDCSSNSSCQSGLECKSDVCMLKDAGGTAVPDVDPVTGEVEETTVDDPSEFKRSFLQAGLTLGMAFVQPGMIADRPPPDANVFVDSGGMWVSDPFNYVPTALDLVAANPMSTTLVRFPDPELDPNLIAYYPWLPDADSGDWFGPLTGNCSADGVETGPKSLNYDRVSGDGLLPSRYCVRVKSAGFVPNLAMRLAIGHFFTPRISAALLLRLQFSSGKGTLANMLVGARGEYMLTAPASTGLMISGFVGGTFGQIQARPGDGKDSPFVTSGLMGGHVGANFRYRISPNFGFFAAPEIDVQLPTFLLNLDLTFLGVEGAL